ncbi:MAG: butyrate kinase [Bacteroidetes bacterium]|jgi:butyrate kinase|nr:butyrate kinase [Bacteroidota bacterium]MBT3750319.1 butyrate kinase [Bacteroidota bacterium]MBT4400356.1 butyrate kinase [Bacteroidota bacterium]MBT4411308.1 butyrate kinase [Bacteroidota bacterium]MBT7093338.1 butyrate kinase [Bacteroidota bacterium]
MEAYQILVINPGSTSTKIAVFQNLRPVFQKSLSHSPDELAAFDAVADQFKYRKDCILKEIRAVGMELESFNVIIGRGGLVKPIQSGIYEVNEAMVRDLKNTMLGEHASNLGGLIAKDIADSLPGVKAYIADPIVVDEMNDIARYSGHPDFERVSIFHALNQKAVAYTFTRSVGREYNDMNLIVAHLGGGISIGSHEKGRVIDVNQGLDGEGPFSPERSGTLPVGQLIREVADNPDKIAEIKKKVVGKGGLVAYLGTNSAQEVEERIKNGDEKARQVYEAMAYQVAKEIGAAAVVLKGRVDAILITGGVAYNDLFIQLLTYRIAWIAPIRVFPGEDEMRALAQNAYGVVSGEISPKIYK